MAAPGSGELSLKKLAKEKHYDDYNSNGVISGAISLKDVTVGGTANSGLNYDTTNTQSPNHPNNSAAYGMGEFYAYDHDFQAIPCNKSMDVVFLLDYTGSMGSYYNNTTTGLKAHVASISNKVVAESGGDYRLAAVLIDQTGGEDTGTPSYWSGNNTTVANLPSANKYNSGEVWLSAVVPFANANKTNFDTKIGYLAGTTNSATSMKLGSGNLGPEPNDTAIDRVINHNLAGSFRSGVTRMVILITDNSPDGDGDDQFNGAEELAKMGTLSNQAVANVCTISVLGNFGNYTSSDGTTTRYDIYNGYANNTGGLTNFSGDPSDIEQFIEDICDDIATGFATVVTGDGSSVSSSGFTMEGSVSNQGGSTVTARGFVRSTSNINLFIGASGVTTNTVGSGTGNFSSALTGLNSNTLYYYKAYATNTAGTSYGVGKAVTTSVGATLYAKPTTPVAYPKPVFACGQTMNTTRYYTSNTPTLGTTVYTNSSCTATLAAGNWAYDALLVEYYFTVNTFGVITSINQC